MSFGNSKFKTGKKQTNKKPTLLPSFMAIQTMSRFTQTKNPPHPHFQETLFLNFYCPSVLPKQIPVDREMIQGPGRKEIGFRTDDSNLHSSSSSSSQGKSIIVVMDASRSKGRFEALDWAITYIVRPKDTVVALGVLPEPAKKFSPTCFPFHMGIGTSGIWVKLEFSTPWEVNPLQLKDEIERKKEEYQITLQPFYRQCMRSDVKLEIKLAAGFDPRVITVEEAKRSNPYWIVLDSCLRKDKEYIAGHVACTVAVMKEKGAGATIKPSKVKGPECEQWRRVCNQQTELKIREHEEEVNNTPVRKSPSSVNSNPQSPIWYPLSWRTGYPRAFSTYELGKITNKFSPEYVLLMKDEMKVYQGVYHETPVLILSFPGDYEQVCSVLTSVSQVRHRSILNLVGYCCSDDAMFLLYDYPGTDTLRSALQCDESARNLSWKARWYVAMEIGAGLRYLHEDCADGPIVDLSLCSNNVIFNHGSSPMLSMYHKTMKWLKFDTRSEEDSTTKYHDWDDVRCFGVILLELITGKSEHHLEETWEGKSLVDWALPLLEKGLLSQVMDPRINDTGDAGVGHMAQAALLCLKNDSSQKFSISQVLTVVRGDRSVIFNY